MNTARARLWRASPLLSSCPVVRRSSGSSIQSSRVEQRAAFDAEGATDRSLRSAAVQRRAHGAELLGIVRRKAPAAAPVRRRKPGLHPLLSPLPATRQTADVAQLSVLLGKLPGPSSSVPLSVKSGRFVRSGRSGVRWSV